MPNMGMHQELRQTLSILLSPRLFQMLNILSLPYLELAKRINKEADENVMLEVERRDEYIEFLRYLTSNKKIRQEADFSELPGLRNIGRVEKNLMEYLLEQLELEDIEETHRKIAQKIIEEINDQGYVEDYPAIREKIMEEFKVSRPTVDKVLKIVQNFEPDGVGARDLKECLLLQIYAYNFEDPALENLFKKLVDKHLAELENQNFSSIADDLGIPEKGAREMGEFIKKNLNPYPGSAYGSVARQVIPSFSVEKKPEGYFLVNLEKHYGPQLKISPDYLKMLENPKTDEKTIAFLKEKLKRAKELMEDFSRRGETLEKVARKIVESQKDFLDQGVLFIKPLSQKSLAEEFSVHPSTVSRAVAEKFIQTPQGVFSLKFLCPRGPKGMTAASLKAMIIKFIKEEDKNAPLTDEQLTKKMREHGAGIDRRTVAYYRKELRLPSAGER